MTYETYIREKMISAPGAGFAPDEGDIHPSLFDFQRRVLVWALVRGKAALFLDCGMGKTPIQLNWASCVMKKTDGPVLIFAPLAVADQTIREGQKFGYDVAYCRHASDVRHDCINIANYEMQHHFDPDAFAGIVVDESSILKAYDGATRIALTKFAHHIPYRLACTATPAPNDYTELCNHSEFLGLMRESEVKALFFTQDGNSTTSWRLKGHAVDSFWRWVGTWAVAAMSPEDLGDEIKGFLLPRLEIKSHTVDAEWKPSGFLIEAEATTLNEQRKAARNSIAARVRYASDLISDGSDPWVVWCNLNDESTALASSIADAVELRGSDSPDRKRDVLMRFASGDIRVLVTKPSIAGFGMNWQHCHNMAFVGLSHSYEQFYQSIRRSWRFGQDQPVTVHVITSTAMGRVVRNIQRKQRNAEKMMHEIIQKMNLSISDQARREEMQYQDRVVRGSGWTAYQGDCVDWVHRLNDESIGLSVFSPPFPGMYVYSNSMRDMGNTSDVAEMIEHFKFLAGPLLKKTMPGRSCVIHLTQAVAQKKRDGYIGLKDFRGETIRAMESLGWIHYGETVIDKNPQVKAIRTKDRGLLFKTLATDSAHMHMALPDYLLQFRAPGDNPEPIKAGISDRYGNVEGWITSEEWIRWARPVWYAEDWAPDGDGIRETDVLNVVQARDTNDERHLAPLQLGVIERCIKLWSNPSDLVFSPFMGIGSEGYVAIRLGRQFVGVELKPSYFEHACKNIRASEASKNQLGLFAS